MNAICYKTKDGLYCIAATPGNFPRYYSIRRAYLSPPDITRTTLDILTREYRSTGEIYQGLPVFEEV